MSRILFLLLFGFAAADASAAPDLVLFNASVFTADAARPHAEAIAIGDGRFVAVGTNAQIRKLADPSTRLIDVGGRLVTPGLIDGHAHFATSPPSRFVALPRLPFPGPTSAETLAGVAAAARSGSGWILGITGYPVFNDPRNWRDALDAVAPNDPVMLVGCCGHAMMLNSRALQAVGIADDVADPIGGRWGRDAAGRLDGQVYEAAEILVNRRVSALDPTASARAATLTAAAAAYARWGVTSVDQMADDAPLADVRAALERANLPIRWTVYAWGLPQVAIADAWREVDADAGQWPARARLGGSKWLLDGTPLERGALQTQDYADQPGWRGRSNYSDSELRDILAGALTSPHQLSIHAVGDGEAELVLRLMAELAPPERWGGVRVRVEHGDGFFGDRLTRAAAMGIVIVQNPTHLDGLIVESDKTMQASRWGARAPEFQPLKSILAAGVGLGFGSDSANVGPTANPFLNILIATTYPGRPDEALTREQALTAYTAGSAFAERNEHRKGRIAAGFDADLAVLSQDVLTVPAAALPATTSLLTLVGGTVVYSGTPFR